MNQMRRTLLTTEDGSHTVIVPDLNLTYHSRFGAIVESRHVFIDAGLRHVKAMFPDESLSILEMGFGTGLNAFLTAIDARDYSHPVRYSAIDAYPLDMMTTTALNYPDHLGNEDLFNNIQLALWNSSGIVHETFMLHKHATDLLEYCPKEKFHLIYFDAFAPDAQPELWTEEVFCKLRACTHPGGALVTYCSKGAVRRAMQAAGWRVTKLAGPPGKWEMVRAIKQ